MLRHRSFQVYLVEPRRPPLPHATIYSIWGILGLRDMLSSSYQRRSLCNRVQSSCLVGTATTSQALCIGKELCSIAHGLTAYPVDSIRLACQKSGYSPAPPWFGSFPPPSTPLWNPFSALPLRDRSGKGPCATTSSVCLWFSLVRAVLLGKGMGVLFPMSFAWCAVPLSPDLRLCWRASG